MIQKVVKMKYDTDCEVAMLATVCGCSWEKARDAIGWKDLPGPLENPIYGNPYSVYYGLLKLGFWKQNITWKEFQNGDTVCVLIHFPSDPYLKQHWIVRDTMDKDGNNYCYFGKSTDYTIVHNFKMKELIFMGYPNCIFKVYKCNIFKRILQYLKLKWTEIWSKI